MTLDQIFKRHFWVVVWGLLSLSALFNAIGVTHLVSMSLAADEKALTAPPPIARKLNAADDVMFHEMSAEPILSRNPFDSVTGPLNKVDIPEDEDTTITDPMHAPPCDGIKVLVIVGSPDPDWSMAVLAGPDGKTGLRRRGGEFNGRPVTYVGWDRVWLGMGRALCQSELFKSANAGSPTADFTPAPAPPPPTSGAPAVPPDIKKGISRIGPNEFNVDRSVVDKILENQADLMRSARIVPESENGKVVGIRLYGVRPDTLLGTLGLENGDRLQTINGFDMTNAEKALEAYARLRVADHLTVQVNRRGQSMNIDFNIK